MKRHLAILTMPVTSLLLCTPIASAAIQQQAQIRIQPATGTGLARSGQFVKLQAYLSTRDPLSTRTSKKANPVGTVNMLFPAGSSANTKATIGCHEGTNANPYRLMSKCATSQVGEGWALLNNLGVSPLSQLAIAPPACTEGDTTQYTRTYESVVPACTPRGFIWSKVRAYQGGMVNGVYNPNLIIFGNENKITSISFAGSVVGNKLSVTLPALGGKGSQAGELPLGVVLSDFQLNITKTNYLKMGTCPQSKKVSVSTQVVFSKFASETTPAPPSQTITSISSCAV